MTDEEVFEAVQAAVIWAKSEVLTLKPDQVVIASVLAEPPIYLDSLEFVAMVTRLEEAVGLIADDERFSPRLMRTVRDVVAGVKIWLASDEASWK